MCKLVSKRRWTYTGNYYTRKNSYLNRSYSKVWLAIDDEIYREIWLKNERSYTKGTLIQILNNLEEQELVSITDESDEFNTLFA